MLKLLSYLRPYWVASLLAPLLMVLEVSMDLMQPRLMASIVDQGVMQGDLAHVGRSGLLMLLCALLGLVGGVGCTVYSSKAAVAFSSDLRRDLFAATQAFSFGNLERIGTASLITRLGSDVAQLQQFVMMLLRVFVRAPLLVLGSMAMAVGISPALALILLAVVPPLFGVLYLLIRWSVPLFAQVQQKLDAVNLVLRENLAGIRVVKAFVGGERERQRFDAANADYAGAAIRAWHIVTLNVPLLTFALNCAIVAVLWFGGLRVEAGSLSAGELVAFINYATMILSSLTSIGMLLMNYSRARVAAERVNAVFAERPEIVAPAQPQQPELQAVAERGCGPEICFDRVTFRYPGALRPALDALTLTVPAGATVALFGSVGAGKSALLGLVPRFYDADEGALRLAGMDLRRLDPAWLRGQIGYVQQETVLFSGSVRDNIRYASPAADAAAVEAAARAAQAHDFILRLPQGYDTVLGQRGADLSGGQRQRLAIARALLPRPPILILDDATSAVDLATEARILGGIKALLPQATCLMVAQRAAAALAADFVVVLEQGRILAQGSHAGLMSTSAAYREIHRGQAALEKVFHD
ncbi:ATP-binding cassette domain-containing protein [Azoarcus indigens]|uniref:ATP-binding cassette subfamily B protein n=1 Tax=Azoarcus indigens TaxID=29545 RepID=A0A4R6EEZ5_9RHOO|nr:ABC transporter ATP-binding protein [Azoarcus indigens]NMG67732.1 ATP-binding cassette domain-containing protein [Azoarcus indigens]TDN56820.1 ATP-binding cassette subfamily B protein [Azoarcus indigens]